MAGIKKAGVRSGGIALLVVAVVGVALLTAGSASAPRADAAAAPRAFVPDTSAVLAPEDYPNDARFMACEKEDPEKNCGGSEQWDLYGRLVGDTCRAPGSTVADQPHPDGGLPCWAVNAKDPQHASGINAMGAWAQGNWGRDEILIGYIEGGINYSSDDIKDGLNNIYLNPGESPYPQGADGQDRGKLDYDGNGRFDIRDYAQDPRVNPACPQGVAPFSTYEEGTTRGCVAGGRHDYLNAVRVGKERTPYLSPEDLIAVFGHCKVTAGKLGECPPGGKFDNDGNGYPNDVSGWNVARNTNDPQTEDSGYGHASDLMAETVAQRNDGYNKIGTCPDCRIVPIKQGAECLGLSDKWAEALLYGVNLGVKVISSVVVSYQYSSYGRAAVEYANDKGVLLSFDSNDFDSTDHTDGMLYPHAIPGNGVIPNDNRARTATTKWFRARSNVTSYGPHHVFSGMQTTTSGATPFMAGLLGMVQAAAYDAKDAKTIPRIYAPNEVRQALMNTVSPIIPQVQAPDVAKQWPGNPGSATDATHSNWSTQYGYGRIDLGAATALVRSGLVPPTTEFEAPDWYAYVDPAARKTLPIEGYVRPSAWKSQGISWTLEWATGADPVDKDFHTISTGKSAKKGLLGTLKLSDIPKAYAAKAPSNTNTPDGPQNYAVTLRIRALDGNGLKAEDRRTFTARTDPTLVGRAPTKLGGEPAGGTSYADVEGRHEQDLVVGTADGELRVTRPDGSAVPGFPARTRMLREIDANNPENFPTRSSKDVPALRDVRDPISGTAVGDLDHDGSLEVLATTNHAYVYAWNAKGKLLPGFPVHSNAAYASLPVPTPRTDVSGSRLPVQGNWSPPVLADLDGDAKLEILMSAFDGHVYAWHANGRAVAGWPVAVAPTTAALAKAGADPAKLIRDPKLMYSVGVGDVLGTGRPQVFVGGFDCADDKDATFVYGIQPDGNRHAGGPYLPGWPVSLTSLSGCYSDSIDFVQEGVSPPVIMPVEGKNRVITSSTGNTPQVIDGDGKIVRGLSLACASAACKANPPYFPGDALNVTITGQGGAGDLLGTGAPNFVQSVVGAISTTGAVGSSTAGEAALGQSYEKAWDVATGSVVTGFPARQDGFSFFDSPLVVGLSNSGSPQRAAVEANDSSWIHAYQPDGTEAPGFPKYVGQWPSFSGVVGDPGYDGKLRVAYGTREGYLFQWKTQGRPAANDQWWHFHHDERNTNQWGLDTRRPAAVAGVKVARSGSRVTVGFTAPGNDGVVGRAARYEAWASSRKGVRGTRIKAPKPAAAGRRQKLVLAGRQTRRTLYVTLRAVDPAGNIAARRVVTVKAPKRK